MLELTAQQVRMQQRAADKPAALELLCQALEADGLVEPGYLAGLKAREAQGSTYLGQGIAIPHGTPQTRDLVRRTGVRLLHFPEGVDWGDGQLVYLAIGIAARSDEHLNLLQLLTRALGEGDTGAALREARDAEQLLKALSGAPQVLALGAQLVALGQGAEDFDELLLLAARRLKAAGCVESGFLAALQQGEALPLGEGLWWLGGGEKVSRPGLAFVTPQRELQHAGQPLRGLFCLAERGDAARTVLERLCDLLVDGRALGRPMTDYLLQVMERTATGTRRIKAGLPPDARFAHKTGTQRRRICDAGLVTTPRTADAARVLVVACVRGDLSLERSERALQQVGAALCRSGLLTRGVPDAPTCPVAVPAAVPAAAR